MKARPKAMIVSPAKAARLKREAQQERRSERNLKLLLIAIAAAVGVAGIGFCLWYGDWIKQPHETGHEHRDQ